MGAARPQVEVGVEVPAVRRGRSGRAPPPRLSGGGVEPGAGRRGGRVRAAEQHHPVGAAEPEGSSHAVPQARSLDSGTSPGSSGWSRTSVQTHVPVSMIAESYLHGPATSTLWPPAPALGGVRQDEHVRVEADARVVRVRASGCAGSSFGGSVAHHRRRLGARPAPSRVEDLDVLVVLHQRAPAGSAGVAAAGLVPAADDQHAPSGSSVSVGYQRPWGMSW